jgi:hypothetical protein
MDVRRKLWVEERTRAIWAVELHDHVVAACSGPLTLDEADEEMLENLDYSETGAAWIRENEEHFTPLVTRVPEIQGM